MKSGLAAVNCRGETMWLNLQSRQVDMASGTMNYIKFGTGKQPLIILPGLSDGIAPLHGSIQASVLALLYKQFSRNFIVYVFSRKNNLEYGCSTRDMAKEQADAMKTLSISNAMVMGVSQGGMIAQYLAIDYPKLVKRLVLAVTISRKNAAMEKVIYNWIALAKKGNYKNLMIDTAEHSYSETYLKKYRFLYPLLGVIGKPENFDRFIIQANSCIEHNSYSKLEEIVCPTLVIGGGRDKIVGSNAAPELASQIKNCELFIYKELGHTAYEEAKDFNERVLHFLTG